MNEAKTSRLDGIGDVTFTALGRESISRYVDTYGESGYRFETERYTVAHGGGGFVF